MTVYHITLDDERTTEELVAAAKYGYCHSQVFSDNFPARPFNGAPSTTRCRLKRPPPRRPNRA